MTDAIGFIGLGVMGGRMARRLLDAGHKLIIFDPSPEAVAGLITPDTHVATSPADVADRADIIFTSLPNASVATAAFTAADGIVAGSRVRIVIDFSTIGPVAAKGIAATLSAKGIVLLDAPVSGGAPNAEAGTLTLMVSGDADAFARVEALLQVIGRNIFRVGDQPGLGQSMKLVNNLLFAANAVSAFEVLTMGVKAGLDPQAILDVVNVSSGRSYVTTDRIPQTVLPRTFPLRFATELLHKDVKLGIEAAEDIGAPLHMVHAARAFLAFAISQGDARIDCAATIKHFENWAGVAFGNPEDPVANS